MATDGTANPTWLQGIAISLKTQTATWLVAFMIGILSLFSGHMTESVKFALNRADLRTQQYEELAIEISQHIFSAELTTEFIESNWTTKKTLTDLVAEYNTSITTLRKKEFVYATWIQKYWGKEQSAKFDAFLESIREFDKVIHSLNDEFEKVNITGEQQKVDPKRAKEALKLLQPAATKLRERARSLLVSLS
ncbi:hypothetical protein [Pseudoduganella namucuonensis]|uniref:Uncharacterized protein n=1 Tax=Pseudoduganella namucuonensis TaxID=1035707 RepID=A0A1I7JN06_9BURK|nr:hypothetical protein [Pseudoduganella namucuonensis]SFU86520.1 hypothetical protein SAMN05216552_101271 [Pseudoduganella namucuonensis]